VLPPTRTTDAFDTLHGERVADPYRWLEEEGDPEVQAWATERDAHCRAALAAVPGRGALAARLEALARIGRVGGPVLRGGRLFFWERGPTQDQPVLLVRDTPGAAPRVLLNPNAWAADGTVALDWWHPSDTGRGSPTARPRGAPK
jgi:prolyl oligopeptidase